MKWVNRSVFFRYFNFQPRKQCYFSNGVISEDADISSGEREINNEVDHELFGKYMMMSKSVIKLSSLSMIECCSSWAIFCQSLWKIHSISLYLSLYFISEVKKVKFKMVLVNSAPEPTIYYKEVSSQIRESKFCLKHVQTLQPRTEKRADAINVQVVICSFCKILNIFSKKFVTIIINRLKLSI